MDSEKFKLLSWWAMIRWFMAVVLFSIGLLHVGFGETMVESVLFFSVFGGILALNLLFQIQYHASQQWVVIFQIVLDIVFATIVVHLTGGLNSFIIWVYLIGVITAALSVKQNGGLMTALASSFALLILVLLYKNELLFPTVTTNMDSAGATVYLLSYTGLFCGVALIANYLADQLLHQDILEKKLTASIAKLDVSTKTINQLDELMPILKDVGHIDHDINTPLCVITLSLGRIKRYADEYQNEGLQKSYKEIMEAVGKISLILQRLRRMKQHPLVDYYGNQDKRVGAETSAIQQDNSINSIGTPLSETQPCTQKKTKNESQPKEVS
ncbi:hypothetical protein MASR2M64_14490 [Candidatus Cloacimonadota bacterium]